MVLVLRQVEFFVTWREEERSLSLLILFWPSTDCMSLTHLGRATYTESQLLSLLIGILISFKNTLSETPK